MTISPSKINHPKRTSSTDPFIQFVRQTCNDFIELRRGRCFIGNNPLIGGVATIGATPVFVLIHCMNGNLDNFHSSDRPSKLNGYQTSQHLIRLAAKFNRPVVIFAASQSSLQKAYGVEPHKALGFSSHVASLSHIEVPVVLAILARSSSSDILATWLADRILVSEQARFSMTVFDEDKAIRRRVGANCLLRHGIIDQTIPLPPRRALNGSFLTMMPRPSDIRATICEMLHKVSHMPPRDLLAQRRRRVERVLDFAETIRLGKLTRMEHAQDAI